MIDVEYPNLAVGFTAKELAAECLTVLRHYKYPVAQLKVFPSAPCWPSENIPGQACIGFFVSHDDLTESLSKFSERYVISAMLMLRYNIGESALRLKEIEQELPQGVDFCGNYTIPGFGSARVVLIEEPVPAQPLRSPPVYPRGKVRRFFDIKRDSFYNWELCPLIRVDVIKDGQ